MAQFDTVATIVADVATEVGLGSPTVSYASGDANVLQLLGLLKSTGRHLVKRYPWLQNLKEYTFTTTTATAYALPADFQSMVDQTGWDRTGDNPLTHATPQGWQHQKATDTASTISLISRVSHVPTTGAYQLELTAAPSAGLVVAFEYRSRYWVAVSAVTAVTLDAPTAITDVVRLDTLLISRALKAAFLRAKGFDSTAALDDFISALDATRSETAGPSPVLPVGGHGGDDLPGEANAPRQGFGFEGEGLFP